MKITLFLLFAGAFSAFAVPLNSQNARIHLVNGKGMTIGKFINQVEKQTNYLFVYSKSDVNIDEKINVKSKSNSVAHYLNEVFGGSNVKYAFQNGYIVLIKRAAINTTVVQPQEKKVNVSVVDSKGEPIIGASVMVKDTKEGSMTDLNGHCIINIPSTRSTLQISYVGYTTQNVSVGNSSSITVTLRENNKLLNEVVVVGYGVQRKATVTGAVASLDNKELVMTPVANITNGLAGKLPGLRVVNTNGEPGWDSPNIDIRGFGSALIIVDGVPSDFSQIDPNEIENISILKDASAAVYGIRAANGVILVTTKRGINEKTQINFSSTFSWQRPTIYPKMCNAAEFVELTDEDKVNRGQGPVYGREELTKWQAGGEGYESTDWYKEIIKSWAPQQQYNVNIRGGNSKLKYFSSLGYLNEDGMWKTNTSNFSRFNFRSNVDADLGHGLSTSISLSGRREKRHSPYTSVFEITSSIQRNYPTTKPYANDNPNYYGVTTVPIENPDLIISNNAGYYKGDRKTFEGIASLKYDASAFVKGLDFKAQYYYNDFTESTNKFQKKYNLYSYDKDADTYNIAYTGNDPSSLTRAWSETQVKIFQGSINYANVFAKVHDVKALFLVETQQTKWQDLTGYREFSIDAIDEINNGVDANKNTTGTSSSSGRIGYIGRINYAYMDKYLLELSCRYDGSSKFSKGSRWGFFPSISAGWRISEELFMQKLSNVVDNLKLRFSYGRLGDDTDVADYQFLSGYTYPYSSYIFGSDVMKTLVSKGLANSNITWYKADSWNAGLDFGFFKNKLSGSFDVFYRHRLGLLTTRAIQIPTTFGSALPQENLNTDNTKGFELVLNYIDKINDFHYSVSGNLSYTRAKYGHVERSESDNAYVNWRNNGTNRWKNIYWGYKSVGQFQSQDDINTSPVQDGQGNRTLHPGDIKYQDYNNDGVIDDGDVHIIGRGSKPELFF